MRDVLHFVVRSDVLLAGDASISMSVVSLNRIGCFGILDDTLRCAEKPSDDVGLISSLVLDASSTMVDAVAFEVDDFDCIPICGSGVFFRGVFAVEDRLVEGQEDDALFDVFVIESSSWSSSSSDDSSVSFLL